MEPIEENIVIVSDLHLGADGGDPAGHRFVRFVDSLGNGAQREGRACRLLILGDLLDFVEVEVGTGGRRFERVDRSARAALAKLDLLGEAHAHVFAALGRFAAAGMPIDVVPGNHDAELLRASAQRRFGELARRHAGLDAAPEIAFHPWIYYIPGLLYAEHGQQHHDINSFPLLLWPYCEGDAATIELPLGAHFHEYNRSRRRGRFARAAFAELYALAGPRRARRRAAYRREVLPSYARQLGFSHHTVRSIDLMTDVSVPALIFRLGRKAVTAGSRRLRGLPPAAPDGYLLDRPAALHALLEAEGKGVPLYVFGHTHAPKEVALFAGGGYPRYLNTGTWTSNGPRSGAPACTFVQVVRRPGRALPVAGLFFWNDAAGRAEPLSAEPESIATAWNLISMETSSRPGG